MKPIEIEPIDGPRKPGSRNPDRLTQLLIWGAFFLLAALAALIADLWLWPTSDQTSERVAIASEPTAPAPTLTLAASATPWSSAQPSATLSPTVLAASPTPATPPPCVPPADWDIHIVQEGNTLYSLAARYGTDVDTLMYVNCLNTTTIFIDQRLYVPGTGAAPTLPLPLEPLLLPTVTPRPGASATPAGIAQATATPIPLPTARSPFKVNIPNRYLNIVLLGSDKRPNSGAWRTDSMIIVSVDQELNVVRLLSIPRDLWVYIPGHGENRINTADLWGELAKKGGGPERVKQTIYQNLGIPIHYYVRVDFQGFMEIIDAVGGIDVDVECPLPDINLTAGMHHFDGKQALRYARSRYTTNDFDRGRRQRKVLMALWEQGLSLDLIPKLPSLWRSMANTFETDLPLDEVINLAYIGARLKPQRILSSSIGPKQVQSWTTPEGAAVLLPREDRIRELLERFYAVRDPTSLDQSEKVRLRVLNGSTRNQAEELAASTLRWEGFKVSETGVTATRDQAKTSIDIYNGDLATGQEIADALNVPSSAVRDLTGLAHQPDLANPPDIEVVLGRDYNPCQ
jgi:LCP family protein required for cell wall assembly